MDQGAVLLAIVAGIMRAAGGGCRTGIERLCCLIGFGRVRIRGENIQGGLPAQAVFGHEVIYVVRSSGRCASGSRSHHQVSVPMHGADLRGEITFPRGHARSVRRDR